MEQQLSSARFLSEKSLEREPPKAPRRRWSAALTWICILFMLISLTGALSAAYGFYQLKAEPPKLEKVRGPEGKRLRELAQVQLAAKQKYMPLLVYQEIMKLVVAGACFFGVSMLVSRRPNARNFVIGLCGMALFYHVCALGISILMIKESGGVLNSIFDDVIKMARSDGGINKEQAVQAKTLMQNSAATSLVIGMSIAFFVKLSFYGSIMAYFWSDEVKRIFGEDSLAYLKKSLDETENGDPLSGMPAAAAQSVPT